MDQETRSQLTNVLLHLISPLDRGSDQMNFTKDELSIMAVLLISDALDGIRKNLRGLAETLDSIDKAFERSRK